MAHETNWFHELTTDDAKEARELLRDKVITYLAIALLGWVTIASTEALAQPVVVHSMEHGNTSIRLMSGKCVDETSVYMLMMGAPQFFDRAKSISSTWAHPDGSLHEYPGCWMELTKEEASQISRDELPSEPLIFMVFADGQAFMLRKTAFTKKSGQTGV